MTDCNRPGREQAITTAWHRPRLAASMHAVAVGLALSACVAPDATSQPGTSVRDSAGIVVVDSRSPRLPGGSCTVALRASLSIGDGTVAGLAYELSRVRGAYRFANKGLAVIDGASREIRLFDSTGRHVRSAGGRGAGPGEFPIVRSSAVGVGDSIYVSDNLARVSVFSPDGTLGRMTSLPPRLEILLGVMAGGVMVVDVVDRPGFEAGERAQWTATHTYTLFNPDGSRRGTVGPLPAVIRTRDPAAGGQLIFGPRGSGGAWGDLFYWAFGGGYEVRAYSDSGQLKRIIRRAWTPVPVTRGQFDEYKDASLARTDERIRAQRRVELDVAVAARHLPAYDTVVVDRTGKLWLREYRIDERLSSAKREAIAKVGTRWSIFDREGVWLCDVAIPAGLRVLDIGQQYVLGIARDSDGVEIVQLHVVALGAPGRR